VYYCCSNGWQTSPCGTTTTTIPPTTTTTTTIPPTTTTTTCTRSNPTVSITPSSQSGNPGESKSYTVTVTNNDNSACGSSTFSLSVVSCLSGWSCSLSSNSLTISPGSSASTTITVTSSSDAQVGTYSFTVRATNNQASSYYGQGSANYTVSFPNCSEASPRIILHTPILYPGGNINATIEIACNEWEYRVKNLTLSLKIDNIEWLECFLNGKGLVTDLGWNGTEQDVSSSYCKKGSYTSNQNWYCDNDGKCKHQNYNLYVFSDSSRRKITLNFVCPVPRTLPVGTHTLTVEAKIYRTEIKLRPAITGFMVVGVSIKEILILPLRLFRQLIFPQV